MSFPPTRKLLRLVAPPRSTESPVPFGDWTGGCSMSVIRVRLLITALPPAVPCRRDLKHLARNFPGLLPSTSRYRHTVPLRAKVEAVSQSVLTTTPAARSSAHNDSLHVSHRLEITGEDLTEAALSDQSVGPWL